MLDLRRTPESNPLSSNKTKQHIVADVVMGPELDIRRADPQHAAEILALWCRSWLLCLLFVVLIRDLEDVLKEGRNDDVFGEFGETLPDARDLLPWILTDGSKVEPFLVAKADRLLFLPQIAGQGLV